MPYIIGGAALFIFLVILILCTRRKDSGKAGEKLVQKELEKLTYSPRFVFNDYYLVPHENASVQIDHVVVCEKGVIVIETKNISGEVYGSEGETYWKQVLANGKITNEHNNPIRQNETHVRCLSKAVSRNVKYVSLVVLVQNNAGRIKATEAVNLRDLLRRIEGLPSVMGKGAVTEIGNIISGLNAKGKISKRKHLRNIRRRHKK